MTRMAAEEFQRLEAMRQSMRRERCLRNWTAARLAQEACKSAKNRGVDLHLKQQSVSALELGRLKSIPYWIEYVNASFLDNPINEVSSVSIAGLETSKELKTEEITQKNHNITKNCSKKIKIPDQQALRNLLLGLLIPVETNVSLESKHQIANVLAKHLPKGLEQISLFQ